MSRSILLYMVSSSTIACRGNSFRICPVIRSKPGALWLLHLLISSVTSVVEHCGIGSVIGHALSRYSWTVLSVLRLAFVCGGVNTLEKCAAKAVALSLSVVPQFPSSCRSGGTCVIGRLNCLVAFQME